MNGLFWHSSDVFIPAHIETIQKLKKLFISEEVYVVNLDPAVKALHFGGTRCGTRTYQSVRHSTNTCS